MLFQSCSKRAWCASAIVLSVSASLTTAATTYTTQRITVPSGFRTASTYATHAAGGGVVAGIASVPAYDYAYIWSAANPGGISLHPAGCTASLATCTDGILQGGNAYKPSVWPAEHAFLWSGSAASASDLNPAFADASSVNDVTATQQVGYTRNIDNDGGNIMHAVVWSGSAGTAVNLHPSTAYSASAAYGTDGIRQSGIATIGGQDHAMVWSSTVASAIDLNPSVASSSAAIDVIGNQEVGYARIGGYSHAALWKNSAASFVDLNPTGFNYSQATSADATRQVGAASNDTVQHAMLWTGTAGSAIDLGALLGAGFPTSNAESIVGDTIYGVAQDQTNRWYSVVWTVPEPTSLSLLLSGGLLLRRSRR